MIELLRRIRVGVSVAVLLLGGLWVFSPKGLAAFQEPADDPCPVQGSEVGPCNPDVQHIFDGTCEGTDCYMRLEVCC